MKNSVILGVTNDELELVVEFYESTNDMAKALKITANNARSKVSRPPKNKKTKYVRVWLEEETNDNQRSL